MCEMTSKGLAKGTLTNILTFLSHALDYAVYPAQITSNPDKYIKVSKKAPTNITKRTIMTKERFNELLTKYPFGSSMYIPLLLLYHTGMRIGEVCGLTWDDIDLNKNIINLNHQVVYIESKGDCFSTLKTETSNREIALDKFLAIELRRWYRQQEENKFKTSKNYVNVYQNIEGMIIQMSCGLKISDAEQIKVVCTHQNGRIVKKGFIVRKLEVENLNVHSFIHTQETQYENA